MLAERYAIGCWDSPAPADWLVTGITGDALVGLGSSRSAGRDFGYSCIRKRRRSTRCREEGIDGNERALVEQDLRLRDLTINAIAIAADGEIIDPLFGLQDIEARMLRHTPGFGQDPIRILRLARLACPTGGLRLQDCT